MAETKDDQQMPKFIPRCRVRIRAAYKPEQPRPRFSMDDLRRQAKLMPTRVIPIKPPKTTAPKTKRGAGKAASLQAGPTKKYNKVNNQPIQFPAKVFPAKVFPANGFPAKVFPANGFPAKVFPAKVNPSPTNARANTTTAPVQVVKVIVPKQPEETKPGLSMPLLE